MLAQSDFKPRVTGSPLTGFFRLLKAQLNGLQTPLHRSMVYNQYATFYAKVSLNFSLRCMREC